MKTLNLLFLCTGNSCRSQMAEGWARQLAQALPDFLEVEVDSAGLEAHGLNPKAVAVMAEMGVDITSQQSTVICNDLLERADLVVSVCSHADQHCPALPTGTEKLHLPFDDPAAATGSEIEIMEEFRRVCIQIRQAVADLLQSLLLNELDQTQGSVFDKNDIKIVSRETGFDGFIPIDVLHLKYKLYSGGWSEEIRRELAVRSSAVGVLLFDPKRDAVVMVRQFRTGILTHDQSPWILEVVAGMVGTGEAPADVVKREAKEEANCEVTELISICSYFNSPGWSNEKIYLYCGLVDSEAAGGVHGLDEEHEDILVVTLSFDKAVNAVKTGEINNAMAVIAIQWLQLNKEQVIKQWHTESGDTI